MQEHLEEGGAAKSKESGLASDPKQPEDVAEAPQVGAAEHHALAQNQAQAEGGHLKVAVQAPYKEDHQVVVAEDSHKQIELGARGVPLGKKSLDGAQNDLAVEERSPEKGKEQMEREFHARQEKEQADMESKEKMARKQELDRIERVKLEKEVQARLEKERLERERQELLARQKLEKEQADKARVEREVQARVEKERLERERREKQERERVAKEKQEKAAELQQAIHKADSEILKAKKEENAQERHAQLERAVEDGNVGKAAPEPEREDGEALKKGGRDLKENVGAQADLGEAVEDRADAQPKGEADLRRRRRELGPEVAKGPPEDSRAVPGLEPLLALGGSNLHAALEEQLLAGAMVHSRQIKQAPKDE